MMILNCLHFAQSCQDVTCLQTTEVKLDYFSINVLLKFLEDRNNSQFCWDLLTHLQCAQSVISACICEIKIDKKK